MPKPRAIIYRDHLLPFSETFVKAQAEALVRFDHAYLGSRRVPGLPLEAERVQVLNQGDAAGWAREGAFKLAGLAPAHHRWLARQAPSLIHAHFGPDGTYALPLARAHGLPLLVTFHGYDTLDPARYSRRELSKRHYLRHLDRLKQEAAGFIAVSDHIRDRLLERGFPPARLHRLYIGLDVARWQPPPDRGREAVVLFVGRLVRWKGCHLLIEAFAEVARRHPTALLAIIGDGPERAELESLAAPLGGRVRFLGRQPPAQVRDWMGRARLLCVPSTVDDNGQTEAFGMVTLEAQAVGLPVVAFANGGLPEAVADDRTGLLCPPAEGTAGLTRRLQAVLHDPALWNRLSDAAIAHVRDRFDIRTCTRRLESLYQTCVTG